MSVEISVSYPGKLGDIVLGADELQQKLQREVGCDLYVRGWVHGFIAYVRSSSVQRVRQLISEAHFRVDSEYESGHQLPDSEQLHDHQQLQEFNGAQDRIAQFFARHYAPRETAQEAPFSEIPVVMSEPAPEPLVHADVPEYERVVAGFLIEIKAILLQRQVNPQDLDNLLAMAHELVDQEDPVNGPHAGLIINLEQYVAAHRTSVEASGVNQTMISA